MELHIIVREILLSQGWLCVNGRVINIIECSHRGTDTMMFESAKWLIHRYFYCHSCYDESIQRHIAIRVGLANPSPCHYDACVICGKKGTSLVDHRGLCSCHREVAESSRGALRAYLAFARCDYILPEIINIILEILVQLI